MATYKSFETARLFLRPTATEDAAFLLDLFNSPKWIQYIGERNVKTVTDAEDYIEQKMRTQLNRLGFSNFTVINKVTHEKMGVCGLYDRDGLDGVDLGFAFLPPYEKQGYAFEAANRIKEAAFCDFGLKYLNAITIAENTNSRKLLEKLGFGFVKLIHLPGDGEELMLYILEDV